MATMSQVPRGGGTAPPGRSGGTGGTRGGTAGARGGTAGARRGTAGARRAQILDAAADLFARKGFHGVPIDEIGATVGITGPALYRHFAGKEAILAEMLVSISERLLAGARERLMADDGAAVDPGAVDPARATAVLTELVDRHIDFALDHPALITIQFRDLDALPPQDLATVRRLQRAYVATWAELIRAARSTPPARTLDSHEASAMAHAAFGLLNSTPHSARLGRAATARLLRRMALRALLAPDPPDPA